MPRRKTDKNPEAIKYRTKPKEVQIRKFSWDSVELGYTINWLGKHDFRVNVGSWFTIEQDNCSEHWDVNEGDFIVIETGTKNYETIYETIYKLRVIPSEAEHEIEENYELCE